MDVSHVTSPEAVGLVGVEVVVLQRPPCKQSRARDAEAKANCDKDKWVHGSGLLLHGGEHGSTSQHKAHNAKHDERHEDEEVDERGHLVLRHAAEDRIESVRKPVKAVRGKLNDQSQQANRQGGNAQEVAKHSGLRFLALLLLVESKKTQIRWQPGNRCGGVLLQDLADGWLRDARPAGNLNLSEAKPRNSGVKFFPVHSRILPCQ